MLWEKDFGGISEAILIQNERRKRKFDSADFFDSLGHFCPWRRAGVDGGDPRIVSVPDGGWLRQSGARG